MSDQATKVSISLRDGVFELTGSEDFVAKQLENFKPLIEKFFQQKPVISAPAKGSPAPSTPDAIKSNSPDVTYENVLDLSEDKVNVLKIPASGKKSERSLAVALLYLWGKAKLGITEVPTAEIREICRLHGCLDESNFAAHIKAAPGDIIIGGSGKSQTAKLSVPGTRRAAQLAEQLNTAE